MGSAGMMRRIVYGTWWRKGAHGDAEEVEGGVLRWHVRTKPLRSLWEGQLWVHESPMWRVANVVGPYRLEPADRKETRSERLVPGMPPQSKVRGQVHQSKV